MKRVQKVVAYITCGNKLLAFTHRDFPDVGVQVVAGTVDNPDDLASEALREAEEETGLTGFRVKAYLGTQDFDASIFRPEIHERHFFHLEIDPPQKDSWRHFENHPTGGGDPIAYDFFWVDPAKAGLFADQGVMLHKISPPKTPALRI